MQRIVSIVAIFFAFTACSFVKEKPPADIIKGAIEDEGGSFELMGNNRLQVVSYTETNRYRRKINDEEWLIIEVNVKSNIGLSQTLAIGFTKRGHSWYYRRM